MDFWRDMLAYQCYFLNSMLNWKYAFGVIFVLAALPCLFGTSVLRAYFYSAVLFIFGCFGVFICKYLGLLIQIWVLGFTIFAFAGFLILENMERLLAAKFRRAYAAILKFLSCLCLPFAFTLKYHRYLQSSIIMVLCIIAFSVCEHYRMKNKRQFYTYLDLLNLSDMEEI